MTFKFYKTQENNKGKPQFIDASLPIPEHAYHASLYTFSEIDITDSTRRGGDFWIDIDSHDLLQAVSDTRATLKHLGGLGLDLSTVSIFASGSKGFHIRAPLVCFGGIPATNLPLQFKKVAQSIIDATGVESIDLNLYKMGAGQSLRIANKQRANGFYKVPITLQELHAIESEADYFALCSNPRPEIEVTPAVFVKGLGQLLNDAIVILRDESKAEFVTMTAADIEILQGAIPACVKQIINHENTNPDSNKSGFNAAKQSLARYLRNSGLDADSQNAIIKQFVENYPSSKYPTPELREAELRAILKLHGDFSCGYMKAVLNRNPCSGCPLRAKCQEKTALQNLINKVSTSQNHIQKVVKAIENATGDMKQRLGNTLCQSLAKSVPSKRSVESAIEIAVRADVPEIDARTVIQGAVNSRATQVRSANKLTNVEGLQRVNVDGLSHDEIAARIIQEIDLDRYFAMLLGETELVKVNKSIDVKGYDFIWYEEYEQQPVTVKPKVFLMNLQMAAGKTTVATKVYSAIQTKLHAKFLEYKATLPKREGNKLNTLAYAIAATITAHRTSLIKGLSERFNVANYQLIEDKRDFVGNFATCIDSLSQFKIRNPLLIVDEAKQTLEHLATAETIGSSDKNQGGRSGLYSDFKACYENALFTILMDADLDDLTVDWFKQNGQSKEFILFEMREQEHPANHTILTGGHDEARHKILEMLKQGRRGVVACTSKTEALMTAKWLKGKGVKNILTLIDENKGDKRQAAFLANPTKESEKYDLILHSPVIGSGVSIENPDLTFSVLMNTCVVPANEALQMLGRNRVANAKGGDIFISFGKPSNFDRVTNPQTFIEAESERIAENHFAELANSGREHPTGLTVTEYAASLNEWVPALTKLQARIMAKRNADLNDYENNFVLLAQSQGRNFTYSNGHGDDFKIKGLREEVTLDTVENRFNAMPIDATTVESYETNPNLKQHQSDELNRYRVCEMAGTIDITEEDVANHLGGAFSVVTAVETLLKPESELQVIDAANRKTLNKTVSKVKEQRIFNEVFAVLSNQTFGNFFNDKEANVCVNQETALKICKILKKHHKELSWRADYSKIPKDAVRRANSYLKKYGFRAAKSGENKERNYTQFFDDKIALYVNNRAALVNSS